MPKTLAGFCLFSGISLLFYSIIQGPIGVKDYKLLSYSVAEVTYEKLTPKDKIDKQKFEKVYRAAKTLTATIEGGVSYLKLQELNQDFLTEISIAEDSVITEKEKEVIELYKTAYRTYKICEIVWQAIIKYNLDDYTHQYPSQAKSIFETLKPIIEQFGLVLIPKESEYSGLMHELHTSELSKILAVAKEYIDKANAIVMGKTPLIKLPKGEKR